MPARAPCSQASGPIAVTIVTSNATWGGAAAAVFAVFVSPYGFKGYSSFNTAHIYSSGSNHFPFSSVAFTRLNATAAALTAPSWPHPPGLALVCIGASAAAAAAIAASSPAACSTFEFVARVQGASLTGRAADASAGITLARARSDSAVFHILGDGFFEEWTGMRCALQCGACSSFSVATFHSSVAATCSIPPICSNFSSCGLFLQFTLTSPTVNVSVANISIDGSGADFAASEFSVNGCSRNCTTPLGPFERMALLRFDVPGRSDYTWVLVVPADADVVEKLLPYPAADLVPIRRGSTSPGSSLVCCGHVCCGRQLRC